jgi:hypothetical protein
MKDDALPDLIDRITKERAQQLRPAIMQQVLDNVYSRFPSDEHGRAYDQKGLSEARTRYCGELFMKAHEDEKAGRITSMEALAIHEAIIQIQTELAYGTEIARRYRH